MSNGVKYERLDSSALELTYGLIPWDSDICGFKVAQVDDVVILDPENALHDFGGFLSWCKKQGVKFCSCRMPVAQIKESILLQQNGFYFVEMNYQPYLKNVQKRLFEPRLIEIHEATAGDVDQIAEIASRSFTVERFHVDPFLGAALGNKRYENWVRTSSVNNNHQILKIIIENQIVGFFIVQYAMPENTCYWHLTALAPEFQGAGWGKKVWNSMLSMHKDKGVNSVRTTISTRNTAVMAVYSSLGFYFPAPTMTFHWHADEASPIQAD